MSDGDYFGADEGEERRIRSDILEFVELGGRTGFGVLTVVLGEVKFEGDVVFALVWFDGELALGFV